MPLDNNRVEGLINWIVLGRKNSRFYRSQVGADVSDVITSLIITAERSEVNVFDYFNHCQRHCAAVKANPGDFLPWNFNADTKNNKNVAA